MATRIKIKVIDKKNNLYLKLPGIPLWLISSLSNLALMCKPIALKYADDLDEELKKILQEIDHNTIRELIDTLKMNGQFDLVDISTGDGTEVKISIL